MIIDLRYHLASLVAVFLALGLGILIGGTMLKPDALVESQQQIAGKLAKQLEQLRRDKEAMQAQVDHLQLSSDLQSDFARQILPFLVKGRLEGCRVAVIETNGLGFPEDLINTLQTAGARVQSVTTISNIGGKVQQGVWRDQLGGKNLSAARLNTCLAGEIARGIAIGDNRALLDSLAEANLIMLSGEYGAPLDAVVLIGGSRERDVVKTEALDLALIDYFLARKIPVYGAEETNVLYSSMSDYQKKGISTVDNIDTVPGQAALVLAMAGRPGHYGVKSTAQKLFPSLDWPEGCANAANQSGK